MSLIASQAASIVDRLDETEQRFALDFLQKLSEKQEAGRREKNRAYLAKISRGIRQCAEGRGIAMDIEEVFDE